MLFTDAGFFTANDLQIHYLNSINFFSPTMKFIPINGLIFSFEYVTFIVTIFVSDVGG